MDRNRIGIECIENDKGVMMVRRVLQLQPGIT
jgi:hypothetical protein